MTSTVPYGQGRRMLTLDQLCEWLNITERHARKLVARGAIPYRKAGRLLRFPETEVEQWSHPQPRRTIAKAGPGRASVPATPRPPLSRVVLPKSLIEWPTDKENKHGHRQSA